MKNLKAQIQATLCCLAALLWVAFPTRAPAQAPQGRASASDAPAGATATTASESFLAKFPAIPGVIATRIGNSHGGIRIHRANDGAIVGRSTDPGYTNSTIDNPQYIQVTESPTEFRVFLMDFHGKAALVWRIPKASLLTLLKATQN